MNCSVTSDVASHRDSCRLVKTSSAELVRTVGHEGGEGRFCSGRAEFRIDLVAGVSSWNAVDSVCLSAAHDLLDLSPNKTGC